LSNNKLKLACVDSIGSVQANQMQNKFSKCHHFTMCNLKAGMGLKLISGHHRRSN